MRELRVVARSLDLLLADLVGLAARATSSCWTVSATSIASGVIASTRTSPIASSSAPPCIVWQTLGSP